MARIAIFIDGGYIGALAMKEFGGVRIDFAKFSDEITREVQSSTTEPVDLLRTYYYNCLPYQSNSPTQAESDRYAAARRFHDALSPASSLRGARGQACVPGPRC